MYNLCRYLIYFTNATYGFITRFWVNSQEFSEYCLDNHIIL